MVISCIIQARMGSTRLTGKVLKPILSKPMLSWVMHRVQKSRLLDNVIIATTTRPQDDEIESLCQTAGWTYYRGSEDDVLDRYYQTASQHSSDIVVRITSDCPLMDAHLIDYMISAYLSLAPMVDYVSNIVQRTYPRGLDIEVFGFDTLHRTWEIATEKPAREHVTYHIYQTPQDYTLHNITNPVDYSAHRWTVDTPEDFELVKRIYGHFGHGDFDWQDVLRILDEHPEWVALNQSIEQKKIQ